MLICLFDPFKLHNRYRDLLLYLKTYYTRLYLFMTPASPFKWVLGSKANLQCVSVGEVSLTVLLHTLHVAGSRDTELVMLGNDTLVYLFTPAFPAANVEDLSYTQTHKNNFKMRTAAFVTIIAIVFINTPLATTPWCMELWLWIIILSSSSIAQKLKSDRYFFSEAYHFAGVFSNLFLLFFTLRLNGLEAFNAKTAPLHQICFLFADITNTTVIANRLSTMHVSGNKFHRNKLCL